MTQADSIEILIARLRRILAPKPRLNVWQWADSNRFFGKGTTSKARHGVASFSTSEAPHQREIMESFTDPEVQTTVLIGASQIMGKTEVINNLIGFKMEHDPSSIVVMYPTIDSAEKFSKLKFARMVEATPVLNSLMTNQRTRDKGNTIAVKQFSGGYIFFIGANSPSSLRGASGQVLIADEIDSNEDSAGEEGDAVELLWKRNEQSGADSIQVVASTPTIEGMSRIWKFFKSSDQRFWFVPCYHCGVRGIFKWTPKSSISAGPSFFVDWPEGKPREAAIVCASCANRMNDKQRLDAYHAGAWQGTAPFSGVRGYHLSWVYCPWPAKKGYDNRLHQMAAQWIAAKEKGPDALKVVVTTGISECWKLKLESPPDWKELQQRCEEYATEIPEKVVYLTCQVDTQSDRLEYEILGWGIGEESWGIRVGKFFGDPHVSDVWDRLESEVLTKSFPHPCGAVLKIGCVLIDSGGQSDNKAFAKPVYKFCKPRQGRHVYALKGSSEIGAPLVAGRLQKNGVMLQLVGTDVCKSTIYARLRIVKPGPGYCHFPLGRGYDDEYFQQLVAESVSIANNKRQWVKTRARNEALDLRVYGLAALEIRNVNLEAVAVNIIPKEKPKITVRTNPSPFPIQQPKPTTPQRQRRKFAFASLK